MSAETWEYLQKQALLFLPRLGVALVVLFVFWLLARGLSRVIERLTKYRRLDPDITAYVGRTARTLLLLFGLVTALGTLGVDVTALVAGLGLTTFVLGFALKDTPCEGRLLDTGGRAKGNHITHRIPVTSADDIDDEVERWLKVAYDMDA